MATIFTDIALETGALTIASTGDHTTLTAAEAKDNSVFDITLTAAKDLIFPTTTVAGKLIVVHNKTGATHAVTVKVSGQTGVAIAATKTAILRCDGTDFVRVTADA